MTRGGKREGEYEMLDRETRRELRRQAINMCGREPRAMLQAIYHVLDGNGFICAQSGDDWEYITAQIARAIQEINLGDTDAVCDAIDLMETYGWAVA
jgi:hypothetical protein